MADTPRVVFVLGPPGSGKGTQCARLQQTFNVGHLSAGDLLRAERQREGSEYGAQIEKHIVEGSIVPVAITCSLLENAINARRTQFAGFLVDGFPRNRDNLDGWQQQMADKTDVKFVLFIDCDTEVCVRRCLGRGQGRSDDNEQSLRRRIETYSNSTTPIIEHFRATGALRAVDGRCDPDVVFEQVRRVFVDAGFAPV